MRKRLVQCIFAIGVAAVVGLAASAGAAEDKQIVAGYASIVRSLDPATQIAGEEGSLEWVVYDNLVTFDRQDFNKIVPSLAESWTISPDGKIYTFKLRKGVKFSTGNELTADDVVYSFERGLRINHPNYPSKDLNLAGVKKIDDSTVELSIKEPFSAFLTLLTNSHLGVIDSKTLEAKKTADDPNGTNYLNDHSLGTGPFMLDEWKRNEYVRLVKNPNYWGIANNYFRVPKYDVFIDQNIPESSVQKFSLDKGDIQLAFNLTADDVAAYEKNPDFYVVKAQNWVATAILMNPKPGTILADPNVRNAIRWGIDYNSIIKDILKGYAIPLDRAFWRPFLGSMKDGTEPLYKYDPAKAKEFMAKSAFPNGGEFTIEIGTGGGFGAPWEVIAGKEASDLAKLGLKMNINQSDWSVVDEKSVSGDYQAMQIWTGTFVNEAAGHIMSHVYPGKAFFMAKNAYANKRLEELGDTVLHETDPGKRLAAIDEINKIEAEDGPYAWVAQKLATYVFPKNVAGFDGYPGPYQFDYAVLHYK
jgi:peptide/nickel transport system substrate-binding protein